MTVSYFIEKCKGSKNRLIKIKSDIHTSNTDIKG